MKKSKLDMFKRISILIFILITVLSMLFIAITYLTTKEFYQSSTQLTDKDVASHIAKFASPFEDKGINKTVADSVFYNAMVLNPNIEVYFLDTTGRIIYYQSPDSTIKLWTIPLNNIHTLIEAKGETYIKGPDPKDPSQQKVFSAAEVYNNEKKLGYIYVILAGNTYTTTSNMLFGSHVTNLAILAFCIVVILSITLSILYVNRLQRGFKKIISVLNEYMQGNLNIRFKGDEKDEFAPITDSFNQLAALLSYNIEKLKQTEQERKNFIATISHDLRTPLSVAKGYTETALIKIQAGVINKPEIDSFMQLVHKKLLQIEIMVHDLFDLSRMESVHFAPNKEFFIFSEILREAYHIAEKTSVTKNITMQCEGCEDTSWIYADIRMMERVVQNLFDNAIKYTPSDGYINTRLVQTPDTLTIHFTNSGNISDEMLHWINTPNSLANVSGIIKPSSAGLGLLIVKKILELHEYTFQAAGNNNTVIFTIQIKTIHPPSLS